MAHGKSLSLSAWRKAQRSGVVLCMHGTGSKTPYTRTWVHTLTGQRLFQVYKGRNAWKRARVTT